MGCVSPFRMNITLATTTHSPYRQQRHSKEITSPSPDQLNTLHLDSRQLTHGWNASDLATSSLTSLSFLPSTILVFGPRSDFPGQCDRGAC